MMDDDFARALVAGMPDASVHADAAGVIRLWNAGAARMFAAIMRDTTAR
jgi:hypothetical protein